MTKSLAARIREDLDERDVAADVLPAVRDWLSADDAFNHWFLETTKGSVDDDALMGLLGGYGETQDLVESAWRAYLDTADPGALAQALDTSKGMLAQLQRR